MSVRTAGKRASSKKAFINKQQLLAIVYNYY
jgi:hypothetical protein